MTPFKPIQLPPPTWGNCQFAFVFCELDFFLKFIYFESGKDREGERESQAGSEPYVGLERMNREIMTWGEIKSQMLNQRNHPGAPLFSFFRFHI